MEPVLVVGSGNRPLGEAVARALGGAPHPAAVEPFPDGEPRVRLLAPVRGREVWVLQPTGAPVGERLLELALWGDACRRGGAARVAALVPYFGLARQERTGGQGEPLGTRVAAGLLAVGGFDAVLAVDLHAPAAVENALGVPLEHLSAVPELAGALRPWARADSVLVAPDLGAAKLAERYAAALGLPAAVVHKQRRSGTEVVAGAVSGEVRGRRPILVDDMISTGGTLVAAARALLARGCLPELTVAASHLLLAGDAAARLAALPVRRLLGTDSLPLPPGVGLELEVVGLAPRLAEAVRRLGREDPGPGRAG